MINAIEARENNRAYKQKQLENIQPKVASLAAECEAIIEAESTSSEYNQATVETAESWAVVTPVCEMLKLNGFYVESSSIRPSTITGSCGTGGTPMMTPQKITILIKW